MNKPFKIKAIILMLIIALIFSIPTVGTLLIIALIIYSVFEKPLLKFFSKIV